MFDAHAILAATEDSILPQVERSALVLYSPGDMYRLVHDVAAYPQFLSWCRETRIHEQSDVQQIASLKVEFGGLEQQFTTCNTLERDSKVSMSMIDGPFSHLSGEWEFKEIGVKGCKILLSMDFKFRHSLISIAFERGFAVVADRLVKDFCLRADEIYG